MNKVYDFFKRPRVWGFFVSTAILVLISLVYFYPDNFDGNTLQQSDIIQGQANSHEAEIYQQQTGEKALWTNALFSGMPTFQISPSYSSNSLFDWINTVYGLGLPAPSNLLFMMMFGFLILLFCMRMRWYYALIGAVAWGFSSYFIIIIGAGHIWKFVALSYIPPTIGGLVLCYRGRYLLGGALTGLFAMLQLNANHPQMSYYFAFVMLGFVIAYLVYAIRDKSVKRWIAASAVVAGAGVLAIGANLPSIYNTYEYAKETKRSQSELTPLAAEAQETADERPTGGMPKSQIVGWSYGRSEMFTLLIPNIKGGASARPVHGQMEMMSLDKLSDAQKSQYAQLLAYFSQYFNDSEGTNGPVYVGAIVFALFILGCIIVKGPMKWCLLTLTVISMLLSLGSNLEWLTDLMIYNFPMYNKFRAVESILVIAEFTIPLLAIIGLATLLGKGKPYTDVAEEIKDTPEEKKAEDERAMALYISFGVCAFICLVAYIAPSVFGEAINSNDQEMFAQIEQHNIPTYDLRAEIEQLRFDMVKSDAMRSLLFLVLGFVPLMLCIKRRIPRPAAVATVGVLVLIDLFNIDRRYVDSENFVAASPFNTDSASPFTPDAADLAINADTTASYRVADLMDFNGPRRSYHHKMIGGYHAAKLNRYDDLIQRRMNHLLALPQLAQANKASVGDMLAELGFASDSTLKSLPDNAKEFASALKADLNVLNMLNTKYIITYDQDNPVMTNPDALGNAWLVDTIAYVQGADKEMAALATLDPAHKAVADVKFKQALGAQAVKTQPGDTIYLTSYSPNRLTYKVNTAKGGVAVFSEIYFPWGWNAEINGKPAELARVNYVLRALRVPPGSNTITMEFNPASIHTTNNIAYASVTLIYLLLAASLFFSLIRKEKSADAVA